ncbi:reverse transcriptase domain-containing protein [Tanacetum coccineum]
MKCKPLYFKGTEGFVELTQWFERMETMFHISNYTVENQIKFATCTILGSVLTWWNAHVRTVGHDVAYAMTWTNLKKMMTDKYYPRGEIKKLEVEMWNLKVKGTDVSDKFEKYVGGLPDLIHRSVMASNPKTMKDAIEFATELMDKKIGTLAERQLIPLGLVKGRNMLELYHCATSASFITMASALNQGHYKSDCPELKNRNHDNQAEGTEACGMVYALGGGETDQDPNNIKDEIET